MIFKKIKSDLEMQRFGGVVTNFIAAPYIIYLQGELGAGKTTFCRGFLRKLGYDGKVKSPTYTLVEHYSFSEFTVVHFDLYRIHDPQELELLGIRDYFSQKVIALIEWPELGASLLPTSDIVFKFEIKGNERLIGIEANTKKGESILSKLKDFE